MMNIQGISIISTYGCNLACRHCFFESDRDSAYLGPEVLEAQLSPLRDAFSWIHLTGGEPLLNQERFYRLLDVVSRYHTGNIGVATNGYWARDLEEARYTIERMLAGGVDGISLSVDVFHQSGVPLERIEYAATVISELGMDKQCWLVVSLLAEDTEEAILQNRKSLEMANRVSGVSGIPVAETQVRSIGRGSFVDSSGVVASEAGALPPGPCRDLACCLGETGPFEPKMVWLDPFGNVLICYGIVIGSILETPLSGILKRYNVASNPILSTLAEKGPIGLYRLAVGLGRSPGGGPFRDECDLCFQSRRTLADLYPETLGPFQAYPRIPQP